jgi:hypothetical protein
MSQKEFVGPTSIGGEDLYVHLERSGNILYGASTAGGVTAGGTRGDPGTHRTIATIAAVPYSVSVGRIGAVVIVAVDAGVSFVANGDDV